MNEVLIKYFFWSFFSSFNFHRMGKWVEEKTLTWRSSLVQILKLFNYTLATWPNSNTSVHCISTYNNLKTMCNYPNVTLYLQSQLDPRGEHYSKKYVPLGCKSIPSAYLTILLFPSFVATCISPQAISVAENPRLRRSAEWQALFSNIRMSLIGSVKDNLWYVRPNNSKRS